MTIDRNGLSSWLFDGTKYFRLKVEHARIETSVVSALVNLGLMVHAYVFGKHFVNVASDPVGLRPAHNVFTADSTMPLHCKSRINLTMKIMPEMSASYMFL